MAKRVAKTRQGKVKEWRQLNQWTDWGYVWIHSLDFTAIQTPHSQFFF